MVGQLARRSLPDIVAGVSVALVLLPQSLAYAQLAGMPPITGVYAASLPPLVAALFASSRYLQTGPTALTALLAFAAISGTTTPGSPDWVAAAAGLALIVGVTRALLGLARAGTVVYLLSEPMLAGFTRGAAVLIIVTQVPTVLGVETSVTGTVGDAWEALHDPTEWSTGAIVTTMVCLLIVVACRRVHQLVPGVIIATIAALLASRAGLDVGPVLGPLPAALPTIALPEGPLAPLLLPGIVIALIGFSESVAIARSYAVLDRTPWNPNRDLVGQGLGNVVSGLVGAFPVGGSFTRSALNRLAGARSAASGAVAAITVLCFIPFASSLAGLPRAALGAFVLLAALSLLRPRDLARLWGMSRIQSAVALITFLLTIALAPHVERAVVLGVALSIGVHLWRETMTSTRLTLDATGTALEVRPSGVLWFANAQATADAVAAHVAGHPQVRSVRLRLDGFGRVDLTAALTLSRLVDDLRSSGIDAEICDLPELARPLLHRVLRPNER